MVSVLDKELEYKVDKLKYKTLEVSGGSNKFEIPTHE